MVRDDDLALLEELVGHANALAQQAAGILAQVEDEALEVAHLFECLLDFVLGRFLESGNVHVADARANQEMQVDAVAGNLVARDVEFERLRRAFAEHGDADRWCPWVPLSRSATSEVFMLSVGLPSTAMMTSPGWMPAR